MHMILNVRVIKCMVLSLEDESCTMFLIACYARYASPYVWVSGHMYTCNDDVCWYSSDVVIRYVPTMNV